MIPQPELTDEEWMTVMTTLQRADPLVMFGPIQSAIPKIKTYLLLVQQAAQALAVAASAE